VIGQRIFALAAALAATVTTITWSADARAGSNDLVLSRLGQLVTGDAGDQVVPDTEAFRSLASELGVVFAPRLSAPADTLGYGGFEFAADLSFTTINSGESYWRARQGYTTDPTGRHGPGVMPTVGIGLRKGIGFPLPLELHVGAVHLIESSMWGAQSSLKIAIYEGFHERPLPSLAVRVGGSRLMGTDQIDLTTGSVDVSLSKSIGVSGAVNLQPYGGWNGLFIVPSSGVLDKTPHVDSRSADDANMRFSFRTQDPIVRNRLFAGLKLRHYVFALTLEANLALPGRSVDDYPGTSRPCSAVSSPSAVCNARDNAGLQQHYTVTVATDF
jgi:hypothetical protein